MTQDELETGMKHVDQGLPIEWHAYEYGDRVFVARDAPESTVELYVVSASSRNVRTFAKANGAIYEGKVVRPYYDPDTGFVDFVHDFAGTVDSYHVEEWLDEPAVRLSKLRSGSGDDGLKELIA